MIDEEGTFRLFGYYARDLAQHSGKRVIAICEECGKIREIAKDDYHDLCGSCAGKGARNHNYGKSPSVECRRKIAIAETGEKNHNYGKHPSESSRRKMSESRKALWQNEKHIRKMMKARNVKPNKSEWKLNTILSQLIPEEFAYNGDFSQGVTIGRRIPDFVELNGRKRIIELFGEPFHSQFLFFGRPIPSRRLYNETIDDYKKHGYTCIIFWSRDIDHADGLSFVHATLQKAGWLSRI